MYGKFFEKMILGSVLSLLGFHLVDHETTEMKTFWLSSRGSKRESDATLIWADNQGIRFDIGFIGVGNPEITLDKVSRFDRVDEIDGTSHSLSTIIIVDRVGRNSRIPQMAEAIGGRIIQMSATNWAQTLGEELEATLNGYVSPLADLNNKDYEQAVRDGVVTAPLEQIFQIAVANTEEEVSTDDELDD